MKKYSPLDEIDRRIIVALQADGDTSHATLAEAVGASAASVWRRVKALEERGVLLGSVQRVDPAQIGCGVNIHCNIRVKTHEPAARKSFEAFVLGRPEIMQCYSMSGDWDYLLRIVAADVPDYERFLMNILLGHPSVATASSHFALAEVKNTTQLPVFPG